MELGKVELSTCCHPKPDGIELRDWFAGMAMVALASRVDDPVKGHPELNQQQRLAYASYMIADAMMKARGKGGQ